MKNTLIGLMAVTLLMTTACAKSESEGEGQVAQDQNAATEAAPVAAQEVPTAAGPQRTGGGRTGYWASLGLDEGQIAEIREIRQRGGSVEEIRAVLTEEQALAWDERRAQRPDRSRPDHGRPEGGQDRQRQRRDPQRQRVAASDDSDSAESDDAGLPRGSYERWKSLTDEQKEELRKRSAEKITVINPGTSTTESEPAETATEEPDDSGEG